jgi:starch phosphorylase
MTTKTKAAPAAVAGPHILARLRQQYGCGPVEFTGPDHTLYERPLMFDDVIKPSSAAGSWAPPPATPW